MALTGYRKVPYNLLQTTCDKFVDEDEYKRVWLYGGAMIRHWHAIREMLPWLQATSNLRLEGQLQRTEINGRVWK
ncbi:hypothetical protein [Alicyclobacillus acidoterrestris]